MKLKILFSVLPASIILFSCGKQQNPQGTKGTVAAELTVDNSPVEITADYWKLPDLSQQEKQDLVTGVQTVFNGFYVHRSQKLREFNYDSVRAANQLNADMPSETLLRGVNDIFANVRDLHTGFRYPVPARCVIGGFPLSVNLAYDNNDKQNLVEKLIISKKLAQKLVSKFATAEDVKNYAALQPGDEILSITNLGLESVSAQTKLVPWQALVILDTVSRGANAEAAKTRAVQNFFSRSGSYMKPPSGRFTITVRHMADGKVSKYSFPWLAYPSAAPVCAETVDAWNHGHKNMSSHALNLQNNSLTNTQVKTLVHNHAKLFQDESIENIYANQVEEENISKKIVQDDQGRKFAVVRIDAFVPKGIDIFDPYLVAREKIIQEVTELRTFINENKDNIEGVIFDVRGNGGGYGSFPQLIANIFTKEFVANMLVQPLISEVNRDTFRNLDFSRFYLRQAAKDPLTDESGNILHAPISTTASEMDIYLTGPIHKELLTPLARFDGDENDELPPEYTADYKLKDTVAGQPGKLPVKEIFTVKPVAVLTNSNCYSACDIFTSLFKDHNIAKIIGETKYTGGGGANVIEWRDFVLPVDLDDKGTKGPIIPNGKSLPKGSEIRFAWNKIVRDKAADQRRERYIEGKGVIMNPENVYKPSTQDILTNDAPIFKKIMNDMVTHPETYPLNR